MSNQKRISGRLTIDYNRLDKASNRQKEDTFYGTMESSILTIWQQHKNDTKLGF